MKLHELAHAFFRIEHDDPPSLSLSCKRLRSDPDTSSFDLRSFVLPEINISPSNPTSYEVSPHPHVEAGGARWNPTREQMEILETVYRGGMRTPNARQIEKIASKLTEYGEIQGKNVFYWFQNRKARERQKLKRVGLGLALSPTITLDMNMVGENSYKRKSMSWGLEWFEEDRRLCKDGTLELFPLHPQG